MSTGTMPTMSAVSPPPQAPPLLARRRIDLIVLGMELTFVAVIAVVGAILNRHGVPIHAGAAPLAARWKPHVGIGTPAAVAIAAVVICYGYSANVAAWSWRRVWWTAYAAGAAWTFSLALTDGWQRGIAGRLAGSDSYLPTAATVGNVHQLLAMFSDHILARQPGSWPTDVAGHPPGALLVFVALHRIGLPGGGPAGVACILMGALAPVCVAATVRSLAGSDVAARAALPFLVLFPGAVWVGTSADGLFMGIAAAGIALISLPGWWRAAIGGVLLGYTLYLSYGLVLLGLVALAVLWLKPADRLRSLIAAAGGVGLVVAAFTAAGFWWIAGYRLVVRRYYQGWGLDRPYAYWVWADLAVLVACVGPVLWPALHRVFARVPSAVTGRESAPRALVLLPLLALVGVIAADLSGLSKAEVERIWLPFAIWLVAAAALLPGRRTWLIGQAITALLINSLLLTAW